MGRGNGGQNRGSRLRGTNMYEINIQGYIVQQRENSQYFITVNGIEPLKIMNHNCIPEIYNYTSTKITHTHTHTHGLPKWLSGKESTCQCRRLRFNPWIRKIPWKKWLPTPVSPGKPHGQRSLAGYSP